MVIEKAQSLINLSAWVELEYSSLVVCGCTITCLGYGETDISKKRCTKRWKLCFLDCISLKQVFRSLELKTWL